MSIQEDKNKELLYKQQVYTEYKNWILKKAKDVHQKWMNEIEVLDDPDSCDQVILKISGYPTIRYSYSKYNGGNLYSYDKVFADGLIMKVNLYSNDFIKALMELDKRLKDDKLG